ncbi:MAG: protein kinase [Polyangiales bacterium]
MADAPARIGPYEILSRLGAGGMAETYVAERRGPGEFVQRVCLKRIRHELEQDAEFVRQFMSEAAIAAKLRHAAITQVLDFGEARGDYYLALELVDGLDLNQLIEAAGGRLAPDLAVYVATELATALDFAHRGGGAEGRAPVVHRDVSASNTLLSTEGEVKLTDFGIARAVGGPTHTRTGIVKGKAPYMAPEYARTGKADARCDLFGLGVLLYECLCGERPHDGATDLETLERAARGDRVKLRERLQDLSPALELVVERLLEPEPELRFQSAREVLDSLLDLGVSGRARQELAALVVKHERPPLQPVPLGAAKTELAPTRTMSATPSQASPPRPSVRPKLALLLALLCALGVAVFAGTRGRNSQPEAASVRTIPHGPSSPTAAASPIPQQPASAPRQSKPNGEPASDPGPPKASRSAKAVLEVVMLPYGELSVDGRAIGTSPATTTLSPGEHTVRGKNRDSVLERHLSLAPGEHRKLLLR